jgi:hypothetical protein
VRRSLLLIVGLLGRRFLISGGPYYPTRLTALFNGQNGDGKVRIGKATSTDGGLTWTPNAGNPVIGLGAGGTWDDEQVHAPHLAWDGSQWVMFADGYDGTNYRGGRWTSTDLITFTPYASNPILTLGSGGTFDAAGVISPFGYYVPSLSPAWKLWYAGVDGAGLVTTGFADSTDGITWTKRGQVVNVGGVGSFDHANAAYGTAILVGSTWYVYGAGCTTAGNPVKVGYVTVPAGSEDTAGAYTKHGAISAFSGNITLSDSIVYTANVLTTVVPAPGGYVAYGTAFTPTPFTGQREASMRSTSTDLVNWTTPTGPLIALGSGWDSISAENFSAVAA